MNRREWLHHACRFGMFCLLGAVTGRSLTARSDERSRARRYARCERCPAVSSCEQPDGQAARRFFGKRKTEGASPSPGLCDME